MNEKSKKPAGTREKESALLDFVNRQAQEAILDPNLPASYKDEVVNAAIGTIRKIAERKAAYYAKYGEGRRLRQFHVIYEAPRDENEEQEETPPIITELNKNLKKDAPGDMKSFTVRGFPKALESVKKSFTNGQKAMRNSPQLSNG